jgi:hypothetical protein
MVSATSGGVGVNQAINAASLGEVTDLATATAYSLDQQLAVTARNDSVLVGWRRSLQGDRAGVPASG